MQQVESVLEFLLEEDTYCFNTNLVSYVFDLESYEKVEGLDDVVIGMVRYNEDMMLLIDTLQLYDATKKIDLSTSKSVVVIKDNQGSLYGMVVDEILKIEDVEVAPISLGLSSEEMIINHYKEKDKLINEIVPLALLEAKQIPSFFVEKQNKKTQEKTQQEEFLLFEIDQKLYGIETHYVKEVLTQEKEVFSLDRKTIRFSGALSIRDEVVKVANIEAKEKTSEVIVLSKENQEFCILAQSVIDLEEFDRSKIEYLHHSNNYIKAFYNLHGEVVAIINIDYFLTPADTKQSQKNTPKVHHQTTEPFLVFEFDKKRFSISMENVRQVFQTEDIAKNRSSIVTQHSNVAFILTWNNHAIEVVLLDSLLGVATNLENSQTIVIESNGHLKGIVVNNLDDILYVDRSKIATSSTQNIIDGAIMDKEKLIPTLNPQKMVEVA